MIGVAVAVAGEKGGEDVKLTGKVASARVTPRARTA